MDERSRVLVSDDERFSINLLADPLRPKFRIMAAIKSRQAVRLARCSHPPI